MHKGEPQLTELQLESLQVFHGEKGTPYYSLINKGVKFNSYVGVIQVGNLLIEILPKADKYQSEKDWQNILIGMLKAVHAFDVTAPSSSSLKLKENCILDLYFELFIKEVEYLVNIGLIKNYRKNEGNKLSLKGSILFGKHIQKNLVHQERFFVRHTTYDTDHLLHQVLRKTILLLKQLNTNIALSSRIGSLLLNFPELKDLKVTEATFNKIILNRKTEAYKNALEIARLLLLNYHPNLSTGQNNVLALMFDMNLLWEKFIYVSLRKQLPCKTTITAQTSKHFWRRNGGSSSRIIPDIVITNNDNESFVIDTKWKNIGDTNPSPEDLRQMYVYHKYYYAKKVALVYPGDNRIISGKYYKTNEENEVEKECSVIKISTNTTITEWQKTISECIFKEWVKNNDSDDPRHLKSENT